MQCICYIYLLNIYGVYYVVICEGHMRKIYMMIWYDDISFEIYIIFKLAVIISFSENCTRFDGWFAICISAFEQICIRWLAAIVPKFLWTRFVGRGMYCNTEKGVTQLGFLRIYSARLVFRINAIWHFRLVQDKNKAAILNIFEFKFVSGSDYSCTWKRVFMNSLILLIYRD